jgi:hypothetical protein
VKRWVPYVATRKTHQRSQKNFSSSAKKDFFSTIGTFRTSPLRRMSAANSGRSSQEPSFPSAGERHRATLRWHNLAEVEVFVDVLKLIRSGDRIQAGIHELSDVIQPRFRRRIGGSRRYCFGGYCISPLPKDQFSGKTSTRLIKTSCLRTPAFEWRSSAILR